MPAKETSGLDQSHDRKDDADSSRSRIAILYKDVMSMLTIVGTASLLISDGIASCSIESRLVFSISTPPTELIIKLFL